MRDITMEEFKNNNELLFDYEVMKHGLQIAVCQDTEEFRSTDPVYRTKLDLCEYIRYVGDDGTFSIIRPVADKWGKTDEEIFEQAAQNTKYSIANLNDTMVELASELDDISEEEIESFKQACPLKIVSTSDRYYGASAMFNPQVLDSLSQLMGDEFYIIPSSIHEILVYPFGIIPVDEARDMISSVNSCCVDPREILSNNLYRYSKGDAMPQIAV